MAAINTRISKELEEKLNKAIEDIKVKAPRGAEVNTSSIMRSSLEKFIEDVEKEKNNVITVDFPLNNMTKEEKNKLHDFLGDFYRGVLERKAKENSKIKTDDLVCYEELKNFKSISDATTKCLEDLVKNNLGR